MTRVVRTQRGAVGAFAATLIAAASHALAGGEVTLLAFVATATLALPLCIALAGRVGSMWRIALGVSASQFVYHWSFAGLGVASGSSASNSGMASSGTAGAASAPLPLHAEHLAELQAFAPRLAEAGAADAVMWVSHGIAAILTIALLHRGERAFVALGRVIRSVLPLRVPAAAAYEFPERLAHLPASHNLRLPPRRRPCSVSAISHRGPPVSRASAPGLLPAVFPGGSRTTGVRVENA